MESQSIMNLLIKTKHKSG